MTKPFEGFWMKSAYRIPLGKFPMVARFPSQETAVNTPITEMVVNSLITSHADGATVKAGSPVTVAGIAWDGGYGIELGRGLRRRRQDLDNRGARARTLAALRSVPGACISCPRRPASIVVMARASNAIGQSQATALIPNPAGYHHNVVQALTLRRSVRRGTMRSIAIAAAMTAIALGSATADEKPVALKQGPGSTGSRAIAPAATASTTCR